MLRYRRVCIASVLVAVLVIVISSHAVAVSYVVKDLGAPEGGLWIGPVDRQLSIDAAGDISGFSLPPVPYAHAFWQSASGRITDIGLCPGMTSTIAQGMNNSGQVAVTGYMADYNSVACYWSQNSGLLSIGTFGKQSSTALDINDAGLVVGEYCGDGAHGAQYIGYVWDSVSGTKTDIGELYPGASSAATGINSHGQVTGYAMVANGSAHLVSWTAAGGLVDLGVPGGSTDATGEDINDSGQIVGYGINGGISGYGRHAFLYTPGVGFTSLCGRMEYGYASAINNRGVVAGTSYSGTGSYEAWVWSSSSGMQLLPALSGAYRSEAYGINDAGCITGFCYTPNALHAVLWTPVPEPSCFVAVAAGLLGLIFKRRS